jgi:hypothetical protein
MVMNGKMKKLYRQVQLLSVINTKAKYQFDSNRQTIKTNMFPGIAR